MKYTIRMTGPVQQILRAMLVDPGASRYGLEVSKLAGLETGTLYPVMARREAVGWVESGWEDPELSVREGRPRRRYYQLTRGGAEQARFALAEISRIRDKRRATLNAAQPDTVGAWL